MTSAELPDTAPLERHQLAEQFDGPTVGRACFGIDQRAGKWIAPLLAAPSALLHGEYYPRNILCWRSRVYPIDWESTAIGPGEIDLSALTEGWRPRHSRAWERVYRDTRWPHGVPEGHAAVLSAARVYLHLWWLGDRMEWTSSERSGDRIATLALEAERAGFV